MPIIQFSSLCVSMVTLTQKFCFKQFLWSPIMLSNSHCENIQLQTGLFLSSKISQDESYIYLSKSWRNQVIELAFFLCYVNNIKWHFSWKWSKHAHNCVSWRFTETVENGGHVKDVQLIVHYSATIQTLKTRTRNRAIVYRHDNNDKRVITLQHGLLLAAANNDCTRRFDRIELWQPPVTEESVSR